MRLRRYEILLPLVYDDGREIESEKFDETNEELIDRFGATTTDTIIASGSWLYKGVLHQDRLIRIRVDVEDTEKTLLFFKQYKARLKERFLQQDIWITASTIEVI